jgi:hypothetical protein
MPIYSNHPKFIPFIKNEKKTLQVISRMPYIISNFRDLAKSCEQCLESFPAKDTHLKNFSFNFSSNLDITIENAKRRVVLEVEVLSNFNKVNYALAICNESCSPFNLIRKFHFDFALPIQGEREPKPVYHMQYGGKRSPALTTLDIDVAHMQPWLSVPRLYYIPINFAIFLDVILVEFRSVETDGLAQRPEWRDLIKHNESEMIVPFIKNLNHFVGNGHTSDCLLREYYYGS